MVSTAQLGAPALSSTYCPPVVGPNLTRESRKVGQTHLGFCNYEQLPSHVTFSSKLQEKRPASLNTSVDSSMIQTLLLDSGRISSSPSVSWTRLQLKDHAPALLNPPRHDPLFSTFQNFHLTSPQAACWDSLLLGNPLGNPRTS
jgi:hypothetical protein